MDGEDGAVKRFCCTLLYCHFCQQTNLVIIANAFGIRFTCKWLFFIAKLEKRSVVFSKCIFVLLYIYTYIVFFTIYRTMYIFVAKRWHDEKYTMYQKLVCKLLVHVPHWRSCTNYKIPLCTFFTNDEENVAHCSIEAACHALFCIIMGIIECQIYIYKLDCNLHRMQLWPHAVQFGLPYRQYFFNHKMVIKTDSRTPKIQHLTVLAHRSLSH